MRPQPGKVKTQVSIMSLTTPKLMALSRFTQPTPMMALVFVWVVDTGIPKRLDSSRQKYLLQSIRNIQTFITCTGVEEFVQNHFPLNRIFQVAGGTVSVNQMCAEQED